MLCAFLFGCAYIEEFDPYMRCPEYCKNCDGPARFYSNLSSIAYVIGGICKESCSSCERERLQRKNRTWNERKETTLARLENNLKLSSNVEAFVKDAMPMVGKERDRLMKKYSVLRKKYSGFILTGRETYAASSSEICEKEAKLILAKLITFAEKLCMLNSKIEEIYIKYQASANSDVSLDEIAQEIDSLTSNASRTEEYVNSL